MTKILALVLLAQVNDLPKLIGDLSGRAEAQPEGPAVVVPQDEGEREVAVGDSGLLDVRFRNVDIVIALEMLSEQTQRNIVVHDGVQGTVSMVLRKLTFDETLRTLLEARNLTHEVRGNVIHVLPLPDGASAPLEMRVFRLNYSLPSEAETFIKPLLSEDGKVSRTADTEAGIGSNKEEAGGLNPANQDVLIVVDHHENIENIARALAEIDVRPKQVLVEATIMRTTLNDQNALGIDFNTLYGVDFEMMGAVSPALTDLSVGTLPSARLNRTNVATRTDFNAAVPDGGFSFGIVKDHVAAFIRALEQVTDVTIMANPKLLTLNKQRGEVIVGRRDGYITTTVTQTAAVQTVEFLETGTKLIFRPFILGDGNIRVEIHPEDSNGGLTAANLPFQETTEATVNLLLKDGHTILIGGLFRERTNTSTSQVPGFGNIPVVGKLFGVQQDQSAREEVIILLTVHIVDPPEKDADLYADLAEDVERIRVGARRGLMGTGREQLAEARYQRAIEYLRAGEIDRAISAVKMALHLNPRHVEAIHLREKLLNDRTWQADAASIRNFIRDMLRREAGLPPEPPHQRPDAEKLRHEAMYMPAPEDVEAKDE